MRSRVLAAGLLLSPRLSAARPNSLCLVRRPGAVAGDRLRGRGRAPAAVTSEPRRRAENDGRMRPTLRSNTWPWPAAPTSSRSRSACRCPAAPTPPRSRSQRRAHHRSGDDPPGGGSRCGRNYALLRTPARIGWPCTAPYGGLKVDLTTTAHHHRCPTWPTGVDVRIGECAPPHGGAWSFATPSARGR
jgi:hypothetical protein